jgi:hypothetical protein
MTCCLPALRLIQDQLVPEALDYDPFDSGPNGQGLS